MMETPNLSKKPSSLRYYQEGVPDISADAWTLTLRRIDGHEVQLTYQDLMNLPQVYQHRRMVCVCLWSIKRHWEGVLLRDVLAQADIDTNNNDYYLKQLSHGAVNGTYDCTIHLLSAIERDALLVHSVDGAPLPPEQGYPLRLMDFGLYGYKCVKAVSLLQVTYENRLGYWEDYAGYALDGTIQPKRYYAVDQRQHFFFDGEGEVDDEDLEA